MGWIDDNGLIHLGSETTTVGEMLTLPNDISVPGTLAVTGAATLASTLAVTGAATLSSTLTVTGAADFKGGLTTDTNAFAIADTTGVVTMKGGATLDNNASASVLNITETTVRITGALDVTGGFTTDTNAFAIADTTGVVTMLNGATIDNNADAAILNLTETTIKATGDFTITGAATLGTTLSGTRTLASQTTENTIGSLTLSTDSTYITGTNITYSSARGSSALKLTGTYSGINGGYSNLYSIVNSTGTQTDANAGIVAEKIVINNTVAQTAGNFTAIQGIAKHNHATSKCANAAPYIGVEGVVTQSAAGQIGTSIGVSAAYHVPADAAVFDGGAVLRGLQITCDNASANAASEETGLAIWNMAGTQTNGIKLIKSASGFTNDLTMQNGETIDNAVNGTIGLHGTLNLCAAGGTTAASVGLIAGAGASGAAYSLGAGAAGVKAMSFYFDSTSITNTHSLEGLYINVDYGVGATDPAPFGEAGRFRARLMGDSAMTVAGSHSTVEWGQSGASTSGLVCGSRSNLVFVDSTAGGGTICGAQAELFSGGANTDLSGATASIMRLVIDGTVTAAKFTVPVFDLSIPAGLVGAGLVFDNTSGTLSCNGKIRMSINGVAYWIPVDLDST